MLKFNIIYNKEYFPVKYFMNFEIQEMKREVDDSGINVLL